MHLGVITPIESLGGTRPRILSDPPKDSIAVITPRCRILGRKGNVPFIIWAGYNPDEQDRWYKTRPLNLFRMLLGSDPAPAMVGGIQGRSMLLTHHDVHPNASEEANARQQLQSPAASKVHDDADGNRVQVDYAAFEVKAHQSFLAHRQVLAHGSSCRRPCGHASPNSLSRRATAAPPSAAPPASAAAATAAVAGHDGSCHGTCETGVIRRGRRPKQNGRLGGRLCSSPVAAGPPPPSLLKRVPNTQGSGHDLQVRGAGIQECCEPGGGPVLERGFAPRGHHCTAIVPLPPRLFPAVRTAATAAAPSAAPAAAAGGGGGGGGGGGRGGVSGGLLQPAVPVVVVRFAGNNK